MMIRLSTNLGDMNILYTKIKKIYQFNNHTINNSRILVPLGGIKLRNINKLKIVNSDSFAILSEIKKKPANIISRLF